MIIENINKQIITFERDNDNKLITKIDNDFYPYFYIANLSGDYNSIDGKKLKKIDCKYPYEVNEKRIMYKSEDLYESDIRYVNRYIIDKIKEIKKQNYRLCYLDIEISKTKKGYEDVSIANNPITSITCYDSYDKEYTAFYKNERQLLLDFVNYIRVKDPDILIAWNGDNFDFPYIINRMKKLKLNPNKLARLDNKSYTTKYGAKIFGRILFDLMDAYKKHMSEGGRESWSLDYISKYEFGDEGGKEEYKGELDDLYKNDLKIFLKYNKRDVELLVMLNEKLGIINFFDEISRLAYCRIEDVFMNSKTADSLCLRYAKEHNFVLPSVKHHEKEPYKGGFVMNSEPKLHNNIAVMDMKSLYPSIMIGFNTSYETYDINGEINIDNKFRFKKQKGIIPSIVKPLLKKRKEVKKKLNEERIKNGQTRLYKTLWITQYSLKVIANSFYGVLGFRNFRLYKNEVAASITYSARKIIGEVAKWFNEKNHKVIYGDTDSVFIEMNNKSLDEMKTLNIKINNYFKLYFKQFNIDDENNIFELEFEKVYKTIFFKRNSNGKGVKKRYAGRLIYIDGEKVDLVDIKGFESRRSDNPQIGRTFMKDVLTMIVYEKPYEEINEFVEEFKNKIRIGYFKAEELALPIGLSKDPSKYGNQIHAKAARLANEKFNAQIKQGEKIKYIYVKGPDRVIAFKTYMWKDYEIDYELMIRRIIDLKVGPLFESLYWPYEYLEITRPKKKKELSYEERLKQKELW